MLSCRIEGISGAAVDWSSNEVRQYEGESTRLRIERLLYNGNALVLEKLKEEIEY